jgi:hypothetical protein
VTAPRWQGIFEAIFVLRVPTFVPTTGRTRRISQEMMDSGANVSHTAGRDGHGTGTYTLFEGTSEIQRLVIVRAASGMHIP